MDLARVGIIVALTCGIALAASAADRHALVIGNGAYRNIDPLPNPPNDVDLISEALRNVGFEVTTLKNVSKREMDRAAKSFAGRLDDAGKDAVGVFYFAGHGVAYNGENWLLPVGAEITQAVDIEYESISANKVLKLMEGARNATDILVLDACRNSPFRSFSLSGTRAVTVGMRRMEAPVGSFIAYSTAPGMVAYDGDGDVSPFAEAFAAEIPRPGNSIGDMMIEVRKRVKARTARLGGTPQTPWDSSSLTGRFSFSPGGVSQAPATAPSRPATAALAPAASNPSPSADARLWATVENAQDPAEFEFYLKRFPNGEYAELARIRMKRLQERREPATQPAAITNASTQSGGFGATSATSSGSPSEEVLECREFAGDDREAFAFCLEQLAEMADDESGWPDDAGDDEPAWPVAGAMPETAVWYDDSGLPWHVEQQGSVFAARADVLGLGTIIMRGQVVGRALSYELFDISGNPVGYGQGSIDDETHISYISYFPNGAPFASGRLHVNHMPN